MLTSESVAFSLHFRCNDSGHYINLGRPVLDVPESSTTVLVACMRARLSSITHNCTLCISKLLQPMTQTSSGVAADMHAFLYAILHGSH